jgi:hypothetical protein
VRFNPSVGDSGYDLLMIRFFAFLTILAATSTSTVQAQNRGPNREAQKEAMKKLSFLVGKWGGDASVDSGPERRIQLKQTEVIEYRLDGLILLIEGMGRDAAGKVVFNAVAVISYNEEKKAYEVRAYNDGRKVDSPLETDGKGFAWGFESGPAKVRHVMKLTESGDWDETTTVKVGEGPETPMVRMQLKHLSKEPR